LTPKIGTGINDTQTPQHDLLDPPLTVARLHNGNMSDGNSVEMHGTRAKPGGGMTEVANPSGVPERSSPGGDLGGAKIPQKLKQYK